jgi:hypothetical protein
MHYYTTTKIKAQGKNYKKQRKNVNNIRKKEGFSFFLKI